MRRPWFKLALWFFTTVVCSYLLLPIVVVMILSVSDGSYLTFQPKSLSLRWYARFFFDPRWLAAMYVSLIIGVVSCVIATVIGFLAAYALVRGRFWAKKFILAVMLLPMIVPGIISAIALYYVSGKLGLIGNVGWIAICHSVGTLPIVLMIMLSALQGVDENLENAALSLGASRFTAITRVLMPMLLPALVSAALFSFLGSFDELIISLFLSGVSAETLPVRIWNSLTLQVEPTIAAVSAFLILVTVALLVLDWAIKRARGAVVATHH